MRALLDTNIVFDILCERPFDQEGLLQLRVMHAFSDVELWISAKSYTDLFYVIRRELGSIGAQEVLEETLTWLHACSVDEADVNAALSRRWNDFEDSLVYGCAQKIRADYVVTRDAKGFEDETIPHGGASDFMQYVYEHTGIRYSTEGLEW